VNGVARILAGATLLALGMALVASAPARAEFGAAQLISKIVPEQALEASSPALAAGGRYLAFEGTLEGRSGVFRADVSTGIVARVATGSAFEAGAPGADAEAPSISADGRYVAFATRARLDSVHDTAASSQDVYVANMGSSPPAYELASALDGSALSLGGDSVASGGVALSGDGRKLVFVNGGQVWLRELDGMETTLVSVRRDPGTGAMEPGVPVPGGAVLDKAQLPLLKGAALSADGTTVAWVGAHLPEQVPLLADEAVMIAQSDSVGSAPYSEPLWRRVADGAKAPTRRIVGGGDPLAPGCPGTEGNLGEPACRGPFLEIYSKSELINDASGWMGVAGVDGMPRLSGDGRAVALIGNPTEATNAFRVDMGDGLSRRQAIRQLTRQVVVEPAEEAPVVNVNPYVPLNGHIYDLAISADGGRVAFASARQHFPLAPPNLISAPPAQLGLVELYLVDFETEALLRLTHGRGGEEEASLAPAQKPNEIPKDPTAGDGASGPSLSADGRQIAFSSDASNLVEGDGNEADDVFLIEDASPPLAPGVVGISPAPPEASAPRRLRRLALSGVSLPGGNVELVAVVPGPGMLRARARAVPPPHGSSRLLASRSRRLDGAGKRTLRPAGGPVRMILELPPRLRRLARSREGVYAIARVAFHGRRGRTLRGQVQVRFKIKRRRGPGTSGRAQGGHR
jgi:Tol biopolymer transport system component